MKPKDQIKENLVQPNAKQCLESLAKPFLNEFILQALDNKTLLQLRAGNKKLLELTKEEISTRTPKPIRIINSLNTWFGIVEHRDGTNLYACGENKDGQLGLGHKESKSLPVKVTNLPKYCSILNVAAGDSHTLLLVRDFRGKHRLFGVGDNCMGQLCLPREEYNTFTEITNIPENMIITDIAVMCSHSLIIAMDNAKNKHVFITKHVNVGKGEPHFIEMSCQEEVDIVGFYKNASILNFGGDVILQVKSKYAGDAIQIYHFYGNTFSDYHQHIPAIYSNIDFSSIVYSRRNDTAEGLQYAKFFALSTSENQDPRVFCNVNCLRDVQRFGLTTKKSLSSEFWELDLTTRYSLEDFAELSSEENSDDENKDMTKLELANHYKFNYENTVKASVPTNFASFNSLLTICYNKQDKKLLLFRNKEYPDANIRMPVHQKLHDISWEMRLNWLSSRNKGIHKFQDEYQKNIIFSLEKSTGNQAVYIWGDDILDDFTEGEHKRVLERRGFPFETPKEVLQASSLEHSIQQYHVKKNKP